MTNVEFREWRQAMGWSQQRAAEALGITRRSVQLYEAGTRSGRPVVVPRPVQIACRALKREQTQESTD